MKPQDDEFFAYDRNGTRVNGRYDANGWFLVEVNEREAGRNDNDGYLLDMYGNKVYSD